MSVEPLATPFHGFKLARIVFLRGKLRFAPLHRRESSPGFYDASGYAVCEELHAHQPPEWSCTCGFHAVLSRDDLWRLGWMEPGTPVLEVEISGRVVEHRHGLRGEFQEVRSLEFDDRCQRCGDKAVCIGSFSRRSGLGPSCARCASRLRFTFETLEEDLGVPLKLRRGPDRTPLTLERLIFAVQVLPAFLLALGGLLLSFRHNSSLPSGIGGLMAASWLLPGKSIADHLLRSSEIAQYERQRVLARRGGLVLALVVASWVVSSFLGAAFHPPL